LIKKGEKEMKILNKSTTPNGIPFQLEDWNESYSFLPYGSTIAAYPKNTVISVVNVILKAIQKP
jgi:hypothetical protein